MAGGPPFTNQLHIDVPLTNVSVAYVQETKGFVADKFAPLVPVEHRSNKYYKWDKGSLLRRQAKKRDANTESAAASGKLSSDSYYAERYAIHKDLDVTESANADAVLALDRSWVQFLTQALMLEREAVWTSKFWGASIWGTDWTGVASDAPSTNQISQWTRSGSKPLEDLRKLARAIKRSTGFYPNTLVFGSAVFDTLVDHDELIQRIKYVTEAMPSTIEDAMAKLFRVERVLVAESTYNSANEEATASMGEIVTKDGVLMAYVNPSPALNMPSAAYTMSFSQFDLVKAGGAAMRKFRMEHLGPSDRIEGEMFFDMKVVSADCGAFIASAVAT